MRHIEMALVESAIAPGYSGAEHCLGTDGRKGGALVRLSLSKHVAGRFRDEAAVANENVTQPSRDEEPEAAEE